MYIFLEPFQNTSHREQPSVKELAQNLFSPCNLKKNKCNKLSPSEYNIDRSRLNLKLTTAKKEITYNIANIPLLRDQT